MTVSEMIKKVDNIIEMQLGVPRAEIKPKAHLYHDLGGDSLDTIEVAMAIEEEFDITVPDDDALDNMTVEALYRYVESRLADAGKEVTPDAPGAQPSAQTSIDG
jgi:acyl carrier protein